MLGVELIRKSEVPRIYMVSPSLFEAIMALRQNCAPDVLLNINTPDLKTHIHRYIHSGISRRARTNGRSYEAEWKSQTFLCASAQISSLMKKATLMIFLCISMKKPLLEVGKLGGMLVKSCWWLSGDSIGPWIRRFITSLYRLQIQSR